MARLSDRWFDPERARDLAIGAIWDRRRERHEAAVKIIKRVTSRLGGTRYLVQGLESGRQWTVNQSTLLSSYAPRRPAPPRSKR